MDKEDVCIYTHTHTHICIYMVYVIYMHIYVIYYSAIKENEIFPFAITQMDLESIMLSKISQRKTNTI